MELGSEPIELDSEPIELNSELIELVSELIDLGSEPMELGTELIELVSEPILARFLSQSNLILCLWISAPIMWIYKYYRDRFHP